MNAPETTGTRPGPFRFTLESPASWRRVVQVEVAPEHYAAVYGRRLRQARKQHVRPGFRKGKVPLAMVERDLGAEVKWETVEELVPSAFQAAVLEHGLRPVSEPEVTDLKLDEGEPVRFTLAVEVRPEVTARDYKGLPLTPREPELPADAVDQALDRLREARAVWEDAGRPAAPGDRLRVDVVPRGEDGEPETDKAVTDYVLELGGEGVLPEFNEGLAGTEPGRTVAVTVTYPDDYASEELRGRTLTFDVTVHAVQRKVLPEADDAFASSLQDGQTLLELRARLREDLEKELAARIRQEQQEEILDALIERNPVELPPSWVESYVNSTVDELRQRQAYLGRQMDEQELARAREEARPVAERHLRAMLLLESVRE